MRDMLLNIGLRANGPEGNRSAPYVDAVIYLSKIVDGTSVDCRHMSETYETTCNQKACFVYSLKCEDACLPILFIAVTHWTWK